MMNYGYPSFYNPYNPTLTPQQRIQQYEQVNPQMFQQQTQQPPQNSQTLSTIPVSNIEEAKAYIVDPYGLTPTFFYNASKNEVYLKKTNRDTGNAEFSTFTKLEQPLSEVKEENSANIYENNFKALNDKIDGFSTKLDDFYSLLQEKPQEIEQPVSKGGKNAK